MPRTSSMRELPMAYQTISEQQPTVTRVVDAFVTIMDKARRNQTTTSPSDEDLARAVTAAIKLYAARAEQTKQFPLPLTKEATTTDAIVVIAEMMRFADLNAFDVNMWLGRRK
jgi:hypothetical protein